MHVEDAVPCFRRPARLLFLISLTLGLSAACGAPAPEPPPAEPTPVAPRVFFIQPQDGATVRSPVTLEFGIEGYTLAAVPENNEAMVVRPGVGHHHVGLNTDCLPPGAEIPMADPWVHFGTGGSTIDMMLPPGVHTLTLQLGDDLHHTIEGLCTTISVTVVE